MAQVRAQDVIALLEQEARAMGIDPEKAKALLAAENTADGVLDPNAMLNLRTTSPMGASGVGQVMPATQRSLIDKGLVKLTGNPLLDQVRSMLAVMKDNEQRTGGDPLLDAVHYNASYDTFKKFKETRDLSALPLETQKYLEKVGKTIKLNISGNRIPGYAEDSMLAQAGSFLDGMKNNLGLLRALTGDTLQAGEDAKAAVADAGTAQARKINAENAGKQAAMDQRTSILKFFGIDRADTSAQLVQLNSDAAVAQQELRNLSGELTRLRSVDMTKDPIGWLQAQIQLAQVVPQFNDAAQRYNNSTAMISQAQSQAANQVALEPAGSKAAMNEEAAAAAEFALAQARLKQAEITQGQRTARLSELTTEMTWQNMAFQHSSAMARLMAERIGMQEVTDKAKAEERQLFNVNLLRAKMGKEPFASVAEFKAQKKETQDLYIRNATGASVGLTSNPGDSFVLLYDENALESFATQLPESRQFLNTIGAMAAKKVTELKLQPGNSKLSDGELVSKAINEQFKTWREELKRRNYDQLSSNNPFKMQGRMFANAPQLKDNSVAQFIKSLPVTGASITEKDVLEFAAGQVLAGKPKGKVAQDVAEFFEQGAKFQYSQLGLTLLGVDIRNPAKNVVEYPISGDVFGLGERLLNPMKANATFDIQMFSPVSVERFLTLQATRQRAQTLAQEAAMAAFTGGRMPSNNMQGEQK